MGYGSLVIFIMYFCWCVFSFPSSSLWLGKRSRLPREQLRCRPIQLAFSIGWQVCCVPCLTRKGGPPRELPTGPIPLSFSGQGVQQLTCVLLTSFLGPLPLEFHSTVLCFPSSIPVGEMGEVSCWLWSWKAGLQQDCLLRKK